MPPTDDPQAAAPPVDIADLDHKDPKVRQWLIDHPGPSWREWFFQSFAKTYTLLGLFIGDAIVAAYWLEPANFLGLAASLFVLVFLEYLLYQYLWFEPAAGHPHQSRSIRAASVGGRPWMHPFPYGRWSGAAQRVREGLAPVPVAPGDSPDPKEFL